MIEIHRGNSYDVVVTLTDGEEQPYKLEEGDTLILGVKKSSKDEDYILSKTVGIEEYDAENDGYIIRFAPEDTAQLPFKDYYYDIGLEKASGEFYTVVPIDVFKVSKVITEKEQ